MLNEIFQFSELIVSVQIVTSLPRFLLRTLENGPCCGSSLSVPSIYQADILGKTEISFEKLKKMLEIQI